MGGKSLCTKINQFEKVETGHERVETVVSLASRQQNRPSHNGKVPGLKVFLTKSRLHGSFEVLFRRGALNKMTRRSEILLLG